tara:strand:+ start:509 stop:1504 length:996 start_codon:yes stop_codon:yes gene_type:complete
MYSYYCSNILIEFHENVDETCNTQLTVLSDLNHSTREKMDHMIYKINDIIKNDLDVSTLNSVLRNEIIKANIGVDTLNEKYMTTNKGEYIDEIKKLLNILDEEIEKETLDILEDEEKNEYIQEREKLKEKEEKYLDGEKLLVIPKELLFSKYQNCIDNPVLKESQRNQEQIKSLITEKKEIQKDVDVLNERILKLQKEYDFIKQNQEKITNNEIKQLTNKYNSLLNIIEGDTIKQKILKIKEMNKKVQSLKDEQQQIPSPYPSPGTRPQKQQQMPSPGTTRPQKQQQMSTRSRRRRRPRRSSPPPGRRRSPSRRRPRRSPPPSGRRRRSPA